MTESKSLLANIGGVFLYSQDPEKLARWYESVFGFRCEGGGGTFYVSLPYMEPDGENPPRQRYFAWSVLKTKDDKIAGKPFTVNYRVHSMSETLEKLSGMGIAFKGPEAYPEGIFAWLKDPEGNDMELWEDTAG